MNSLGPEVEIRWLIGGKDEHLSAGTILFKIIMHWRLSCIQECRLDKFG